MQTLTLIHQRQTAEVHYAAAGFDAGRADSPFTETNPVCGARLMGGVVPVEAVAPYALCRLCEQVVNRQPVDLPMGGCSTSAAHYAHLTAGGRYCENGTDAGEEAVASHAAGAALAATSDEGLLRTFAALTHRLDGTRANLTDQARIAAYQDLRAQRDMVQAEVLRRMGGTR